MSEFIDFVASDWRAAVALVVVGLCGAAEALALFPRRPT